MKIATKAENHLSLTVKLFPVVLLKHQDRSKWNQKLIDKGKHYLELSAEGNSFSEYHIEAPIAACHALSESFESTNWKQIHGLYEILQAVRPGPVTTMNTAISLGYAEGAEQGLNALLKVTELSESHLYHTALGDFYLQLKDHSQSKVHFEKALVLATTKSEVELLRRKISELKA